MPWLDTTPLCKLSADSVSASFLLRGQTAAVLRCYSTPGLDLFSVVFYSSLRDRFAVFAHQQMFFDYHINMINTGCSTDSKPVYGSLSPTACVENTSTLATTCITNLNLRPNYWWSGCIVGSCRCQILRMTKNTKRRSLVLLHWFWSSTSRAMFPSTYLRRKDRWKFVCTLSWGGFCLFLSRVSYIWMKTMS